MITTKDGTKKPVVFISVPMHGKDEFVIKRHIQIVKAWYLKGTNQNLKDVCFIDNFDNGKKDERFENSIHPRISYLARAIKRIANADIVIFGHDWRKSPGCNIENEVALTYKIPTMYYYHKIENKE